MSRICGPNLTKQKILRLEVPMKDLQFMNVFYCQQQLVKKRLQTTRRGATVPTLVRLSDNGCAERSSYCFKSHTAMSKTSMRDVLEGIIRWSLKSSRVSCSYLTILGWDISFNKDISRNIVDGMPSASSTNWTTFIATLFPFSSRALYTVPYVPFPRTLSSVKGAKAAKGAVGGTHGGEGNEGCCCEDELGRASDKKRWGAVEWLRERFSLLAYCFGNCTWCAVIECCGAIRGWAVKYELVPECSGWGIENPRWAMCAERTLNYLNALRRKMSSECRSVLMYIGRLLLRAQPL
eukprot:284819207_6